MLLNIYYFEIASADSRCGFYFISDLFLLKISSPFTVMVYQADVLKESMVRFVCSDDSAVFQIRCGSK